MVELKTILVIGMIERVMGKYDGSNWIPPHQINVSRLDT